MKNQLEFLYLHSFMDLDLNSASSCSCTSWRLLTHFGSVLFNWSFFSSFSSTFFGENAPKWGSIYGIYLHKTRSSRRSFFFCFICLPLLFSLNLLKLSHDEIFKHTHGTQTSKNQHKNHSENVFSNQQRKSRWIFNIKFSVYFRKSVPAIYELKNDNKNTCHQSSPQKQQCKTQKKRPKIEGTTTQHNNS